MEKKRQIIYGLLAAFAMLLLILDTKTALAGATEGLMLCFKTVVPSLLPFFVLSIFLTASISGTSSRFLAPLGSLCRIPQGSETLLLTGFMGGYPVGAQNVYQLWHSGQLSTACANRMLGFCSNAGPAFIFGIVALQFQEKWAGWVLWGIHILSALLTAVMLPGDDKRQKVQPASNNITLAEAVNVAVSVMSRVCGWVVLFRMVIAFLQRWVLWLLPLWAQTLICGALELSNGCCMLDTVADPQVRFILASCLLACGGLCVGMQTAGVTGELGTGMYFTGKLLQTLFSISLSTVLFPAFSGGNINILLVFWIISAILLIVKILVAFQRKLMYNSSIYQ